MSFSPSNQILSQIICHIIKTTLHGLKPILSIYNNTLPRVVIKQKIFSKTFQKFSKYFLTINSAVCKIYNRMEKLLKDTEYRIQDTGYRIQKTECLTLPLMEGVFVEKRQEIGNRTQNTVEFEKTKPILKTVNLM
jgi:hypothetical protein